MGAIRKVPWCGPPEDLPGSKPGHVGQPVQRDVHLHGHAGEAPVLRRPAGQAGGSPRLQQPDEVVYGSAADTTVLPARTSSPESSTPAAARPRPGSGRPGRRSGPSRRPPTRTGERRGDAAHPPRTWPQAGRPISVCGHVVEAIGKAEPRHRRTASTPVIPSMTSGTRLIASVSNQRSRKPAALPANSSTSRTGRPRTAPARGSARRAARRPRWGGPGRAAGSAGPARRSRHQPTHGPPVRRVRGRVLRGELGYLLDAGGASSAPSIRCRPSGKARPPTGCAAGTPARARRSSRSAAISGRKSEVTRLAVEQR